MKVRYTVLLALLLGIATLFTITTSWAQAPARKARKVALLIGPETYLHGEDNFKPLPHLDDDVKELAEQLKKGGFDEVVVLTDKPEGRHPATKANILKHLNRLLDGDGDPVKAIRSNDVVLLALSGHGLEFFTDGKKKDTYFAPIDGKRKDIKTLINLAEVLEKLEGCGARNLILADMCREIYDPNKGNGFSIDNLSLPKNSAILFGCESTQQSFVSEKLKHSYLFYACIEEIKEINRSGKPLLWSELVSNVEKRFESEDFKKLMVPDHVQSPVERKNDLRATTVIAASRVVREPKPGEERSFEIGKGVKMVFCWIPGGTATLGSPATEKDRRDDEKEHEYKAKGFWLGKYAVTQEEWSSLGAPRAEENYFSSKGGGKDKVGADTSRYPAESISWEECRGFVDLLNRRGGVQELFGAQGKFALPLEDEWEYACRGDRGNKRAFYWGETLNGDKANCDGNYPYGTTTKGTYKERTTPVGSYESVAPHPWGLCDMSGNVWQWCENWYDSEQKYRVLRGGSWRSGPHSCRAAYRHGDEPGDRDSNLGFRVAFRLDP